MKKYFLEISLIVFVSLLFRIFLLSLDLYKTVFFDEAVPGLMALEMLKGNFSFFYWGAPYLGSLEAIIAALLFKILSVSTLVLRLSPLLFFVFFCIVTIYSAKQLSKNSFPWYALVFLFFPPFELSSSAILPIGGYMHIVAIGSFLMFITFSLMQKNLTEKKKTLLFVLLGFFSGVGFWTFIMIVPYILSCFCILLIRYKNKIFSKNLLWSLLAFILGSLPLWVWNIQNSFLSFRMRTSGVVWESLGQNLKNFQVILLCLLGKTNAFLSEIFLWLLFAVVIVFILKHFSIKKIIIKIVYPEKIMLIVLCFVLISCSYIFTAHGSKLLPRYLMPLYSVIPLIYEYFLSRVDKGKTIYKTLLFILIFFISFSSNFQRIHEITRTGYKDQLSPKKINLEMLFSFCRENNIQYAYAPFYISHSISFESKNKLLCAEICGYRSLDYLKEVDKQDNAAIILHDTLTPPSPDAMQGQLKLLTANYKMKKLGEFIVFYDFEMPMNRYLSMKDKIKSIQTSSDSGFSFKMNDGNFSTYWATKEFMKGREEIVIEFKEPLNPGKISIIPGNIFEVPRGLAIYGSEDGINWVELAIPEECFPGLLKFKNYLRFYGNSQYDIYLNLQRKFRYLKINQTGKDFFKWSVSELLIFEKLDSIFPPVSQKVIQWMDQLPDDVFLVTYPELLTATDHESKIPLYLKEIESLEDFRCWDFDVKYRKIDFKRKNAFVVDEMESSELEQLFRERNILYNKQKSSGYTLFTTAAVEKAFQSVLIQPLKGWYCSDSLNGNKSDTADIQHHENKFLFCNLTQSIPCEGIYLNSSENPLYFDTLNVQVSEDGENWTQAPLKNLDDLYWTDRQMLKAFSPSKKFWFEKILNVRYLKVSPDPRLISSQFFETLFNSCLFSCINTAEKKSLNAVNTGIYIQDKKTRSLNPDSKKILFKNNSELWMSPLPKKEYDRGDFIHLNYNLLFNEKIKNNFAVYIQFLSDSNKILFQGDHCLEESFFIKGEIIQKDIFIEIPKQLTCSGKIKLCMGLWIPSENKVLKTKSDLPKIINGHVLDEVTLLSR